MMKMVRRGERAILLLVVVAEAVDDVDARK